MTVYLFSRTFRCHSKIRGALHNTTKVKKNRHSAHQITLPSALTKHISLNILIAFTAISASKSRKSSNMGVGGRMDFCSQLVKYGMFFSNLVIFVSTTWLWVQVSLNLKLVLTLAHRSAAQWFSCSASLRSSIATSWVSCSARTCFPVPFTCWSSPRLLSVCSRSSGASVQCAKSSACCWRWVNLTQSISE